MTNTTDRNPWTNGLMKRIITLECDRQLLELPDTKMQTVGVMGNILFSLVCARLQDDADVCALVEKGEIAHAFVQMRIRSAVESAINQLWITRENIDAGERHSVSWFVFPMPVAILAGLMLGILVISLQVASVWAK